MIRPKPTRPLNGLQRRYRAPLCLALFLGLGLGGCGLVGFPGVYKIDIEQGNLVVQDMVDQLEVGMSRRQVRFIMGSPLIEDTFNPDRWDYPYVIRNGPTIIREAQVSIYFDGDRFTEIRGDYLPDWSTPESDVDQGVPELDSEQDQEQDQDQDQEQDQEPDSEPSTVSATSNPG